ncbi:hypothetical protein GQ43DRAFT_476593 [Delitschia confertaspora ATCC 74209]|uniref:Uncharacterized protein n=1 Tax=Delitschia confertaspora ATCC 74209 TaxID=1513339 RepID=A0A9P4JBK7_9PLEO|nr:hypothetical protein GQ43DRAFT_476593 [Delitschia confertaspora ATCC 74209]
MAAPNVWEQMGYTPPRGQCNFKTSILSKCTCLRFMLHPLKSASSYDCDGCQHHASYHSMENKQEDEICKRWEIEAKEREAQERRPKANPRKRQKQLEYPTIINAKGFPMTAEGQPDHDQYQLLFAAGKIKNDGNGNVTPVIKAPSRRIRRKTLENDDDYIELD